MRKQMWIQRVAFILTVISVLMGVWALDRWNKPRPCFNSPALSAFHIQTSEQVVDISQCQFSSLWERPEILTNRQIARVDEAFKVLHSWYREFGPYEEAFKLKVSVGFGGEEVVSATGLQIDLDTFESKNQLVRLLLQVWLLQHVPALKRQSPLEQDIITDFALSYVLGRLELERQSTTQVARYLQQPWLKDVYSWQSFCRSAWTSPWTRARCAKALAGGRRQQTQFSIGSLRPLAGNLLWQTYQNLPLVIKARFVSQWLNGLRGLDGLEPATQADSWSQKIFDFQGRAHTAAVFQAMEGVASDIAKTGDERIDRFWRNSLRQILSRHEYVDQPPGAGTAEHLYVHSDESGFQLNDYADLFEMSTADSQRLIVVASRDEHYIFPSLDPVELVMDSGDTFQRWVWQTCSELSLRHVLNESVQAQRVLMVDRCSQVARVRYQPLVVAGVESFAHHNPGTAFVDLQPKALSLASHLTRTEIDRIQWKWQDAVLRKVSSVEGLVGLFQPRWSEFGQAYQVVGAVEGIHWFRGPQPYLVPDIN